MHPHGLQSLTENVDNVALGTLAARNALAIESALTGLTATFLVKRVRYFLALEGLTSDEGPLIIGCANGDATSAELTTAMNVTNTAGPADTTQSLTQDQAWIILRETLEALDTHDGVGVRADTTGKWHTMPGRGIPMPEGQGIQCFIFNADSSALTTGALVKGLIEYQGVWLRD